MPAARVPSSMVEGILRASETIRTARLMRQDPEATVGFEVMPLDVLPSGGPAFLFAPESVIRHRRRNDWAAFKSSKVAAAPRAGGYADRGPWSNQRP
jgi:hypothetical protein